MFETMSGFLWFFFSMLAAILIGIIFEEKLIDLEDAVMRMLRSVVRKCLAHHARVHH